MQKFEKKLLIIISNIKKRGLFKVFVDLITSRLKRDWQGFILIHKAAVFFLWTIYPQKMWQNHPKLVLKALELNNNRICKNKKLMNFIFKLQHDPGFNKTLLSFREMINVYSLTEKVLKLSGDLAEVGVYRGGSAKIICEAKDNQVLHLFDTFKGLPKPDKTIDELAKGEMKNTSLAYVKNSLKKYPKLRFYQGLFSENCNKIKDCKFSFVHLDVDLYQGTKNCLSFFYPRLVPGGIILIHDYNSIDTPGVKKAVDEFLSDKSKTVVELWDSQCLIIKY